MNVLVEKDAAVAVDSLPRNLSPQRISATAATPGLREMLNLLEKQIILDTLIRANWIKKRAADMLQVDPRNFPYLLRKHNLGEGQRPN